MSYFADLTLHTYTSTDDVDMLNIGWLDATYLFDCGDTSVEFHEALRKLIEQPIQMHRGFHICEFCEPNSPFSPSAGHGNGQIRVMGPDRQWYAAPTMVYHYVVTHHYRPPLDRKSVV